VGPADLASCTLCRQQSTDHGRARRGTLGGAPTEPRTLPSVDLPDPSTGTNTPDVPLPSRFCGERVSARECLRGVACPRVAVAQRSLRAAGTASMPVSRDAVNDLADAGPERRI
jgi:hypothetical protein